jgi:hypothetical protein
MRVSGAPDDLVKRQVGIHHRGLRAAILTSRKRTSATWPIGSIGLGREVGLCEKRRKQW